MKAEQTAAVLWDRLSERSRRLCLAVAERADDRGERVYLVGGSVRDLLLGHSEVDLDIVVEGDAVGLAAVLAGDLSGQMEGPSEFLTTAVLLPDGVHIDLATARQETYPAPAKLPVVRPSAIIDDLCRRDFSVNAMALRLLPEGGTSLVDPCGGRQDTTAGLIRVLHGRSFADDPTRLIRAVRFEQRFGFALERATAERVAEAVRNRCLARITGPRLRDEVAKALQEPAPWRVFERLKGLGALADAAPGACVDRLTSRWLREVPTGLIALGTDGAARPAHTWPYLLGALCARGRPEQAAERLQPDREAREVILTMGRAVGDRVPACVARRRSCSDVRLHVALGQRPLAELLVYWLRGGPLGRQRIERSAGRLSRMTADVTGDRLIAAGVAHGPAIGVGLRAARAAKLGGRREPGAQLEAALEAIGHWHRPSRHVRRRPGGGVRKEPP